MTFDEFSKKVIRIWWPTNPPKELPNKTLSMFVAGYKSGLSPEQFFHFMQIQTYSYAVTSASSGEMTKLAEGQKVLDCFEKGLPKAEAAEEIFGKEK